LVDTFNHERYIEQALISVLEKGLSAAELEIVVVDDGSNDSTPSIIQKFAPRVRYVRKKNGGQASAFNAGFAESGGEVVALLDGDDWWEKGKLAAVLRGLEQNPEVSAVGHGYYQFLESTKESKLCCPERSRVLDLSTRDEAVNALLDWRFLQASALTVRRGVLERIMPIPEVLFFSADAPIAAASAAMGVRVLDQPLSYYRVHSRNLYAVDAKNREQLRRKSEMDEAMYEVLYPLLYRLGVSPESVSGLLDHGATETTRFRLQTFGGSRLETLRTEMRVFRSGFRQAGIGYRLFKYLLVGGATLLVSPQHFYQARDWYARRNLGRVRELFFKSRIGTETEAVLPSKPK